MTREQLKNGIAKQLSSIILTEDEMLENIMQMADAHATERCAINGVINWVACKDILPKHKTDVMTYSKEFEIRNGRCMQAGVWFVNGHSRLVEVIHWSELPKPPCL